MILHARHYPFVAQLPDIDEYKFFQYPEVKTTNTEIPSIELYDADKVVLEIREQERPLPFSTEVLGYETYLDSHLLLDSIFDWSAV